MRHLPVSLLLLFVLLCGATQAQHQHLRAVYRHMADTAATDSIRIKAYTKLTEEYLDSSYSMAMHYAELSDSLADAYPTWAPGKVLAQTAIGYVYQAIDLPDTALYYFHKARTLALGIPNKNYLKKCTYALHRFFKDRNEDSAFFYAKEQLMYARQVQDTSLEIATINELGNFYFDRGNNMQAISWWQPALPVLRKLRQPNREAIVLMNIGKAWLALGQQDSARLYLFAARTSAGQEPYFTEQAEVALALFEYYQKINKPDSARAAAEMALKLSTGQEDKPQLRDIWETLTDIYEQTGQPVLALKAYKQFIMYRDSVTHEARNLDDAKKILSAAYTQQLTVSQRAQEELRLTGHLQRRLLLAAGIGLLLLGTLAFGYYRALVRNRKRERTIAGQAALLRDQKATIQTALSEKDLLMREIHHRVKNNLQIITGLQQMQANRSDNPSVKAALEDSQNRVLSIAFIHQNLYQHDDLKGVEMQSFVRELATHILDVCISPDKKIRLERDIAPITLDIDTAIPIGLIINELFTNSCKHAFKEKEHGMISIRFWQDDAGSYRLQYEDDGPGLSADVDFEKADSLGLRLIRQLADQLDGRLQYSGSRFMILFKDFETRNRD